MPRNDRDAFPGRARKLVAASLAALTVFWCAIRFVGLEASPHGYFGDETLSAVQVMCLAEIGPGEGKRWPLFVSGGSGGFYSAPYLYFAIAWTRLFGTSIPSFRGIAAFFSVATIAGLAAVAYRLDGALLALTTALCAALSPWSFQFSRIAWDPPLAPAFLVWGTVLLLRARRLTPLIFAGVAFALSMYAYPPARVQSPLWLIVLSMTQWWRGELPRRGLVTVLGSATLASVPLVVVLASDHALMQRSVDLSIFGAWWLEQRGASSTPLFILRTFLDNLHAQLRPSYLFFSGDGNLRHSTQAIGELSPVDDLALVFFTAAAAARILNRLVPTIRFSSAPPAGAEDLRLGYLFAAGALLGTIPAALTWDGIPHALRSIGTWPFVALLSGLALARAWRRRAFVGPLILAVGLGHSAVFLPRYFAAYRDAAPMWFHRDLKEAVEAEPRRPAREALRPFVGAAGYSRAELQYYLMHYERLGCREAETVSREMWPDPP